MPAESKQVALTRRICVKPSRLKFVIVVLDALLNKQTNPMQAKSQVHDCFQHENLI